MHYNFANSCSYMDVYVLTDDAIMRQIGAKLKDLRIEKNLRQSDLTDASGVSVSTISAIENGKATSLITIIQLLRALGHLDYLDSFFQEETISPIAYEKLMKNNKKKERVRSTNEKIVKEDTEW